MPVKSSVVFVVYRLDKQGYRSLDTKYIRRLYVDTLDFTLLALIVGLAAAVALLCVIVWLKKE